MSRRKSNSKRAPRTPEQLRRVRNVWLSLLASMTVVGGVLLMADTRSNANAAPFVLPAAAQIATGSSGMEPIFSKIQAPITPGRWKAIVIHHSAKAAGSGQSIDEEHRQAGLSGLGHHFVIGNGRGNMEAGEIYVGYRWNRQEAGNHAKGSNADWYNQNAISICLVGDGDRKGFDGKQMERTAELVSALCRQLNIPAKNVVLHRDIAKVTDPGRAFPEAWLREQLGSR